MSRQNLPLIFSVLLVGILLVAFFMKGNLNDFISKKIQESAGSEIVLSGQQWVDSLFNYNRNGHNYEFTLLQFKSNGCTICTEMEPVLEAIKINRDLKVNVAVMNVMNPNSMNLMKYYGISAVPTQIILDKNGIEIFRKHGFVPAQELRLHLIHQSALSN